MAEKRLIDADSLLEKIDFRIDIQGLVGATVRDMVALTRKIITAEPTVDAVEVVRCKDCKLYNGHRYCHYFVEEVLDDDFCSYGERRNDG